MNGDLKTTFIQRSLSQYMEDVIRTMRVVAQRAKIGVSGDAMRSLSYDALAKDGGGVANLTFKEYLRMVDMGVGKGHPLGGLTTMRVSLKSQQREGVAQVKNRGRKPKKVYSKIAYGKLTWLQNQLLYGYTEETVAALKKELTQ